MTISLFWASQTRSSRLVWLLEELGVDYTRVPINIRNPDRQDPPEFLKASPMGKVPAIVDGEVFMSESAAMGIYLGDKYSSGKLAPAFDAPDRGTYLYWMLYTPSVIEPAMSEKAAGVEPNKPRNGWGTFDLMLKVLTDSLSDRPWLLGDNFSLADVLVGSSVVFLRMFEMLPDNPTLSAYADRCLARPGYEKALALDRE